MDDRPRAAPMGATRFERSGDPVGNASVASSLVLKLKENCPLITNAGTTVTGSARSTSNKMLSIPILAPPKLPNPSFFIAIRLFVEPTKDCAPMDKDTSVSPASFIVPNTCKLVLTGDAYESKLAKSGMPDLPKAKGRSYSLLVRPLRRGSLDRMLLARLRLKIERHRPRGEL